MTYADREPTRSMWMLFGIANAALQLLTFSASAFVLLFILAFCDAPGSCQWAAYLPMVGAAVALAWPWQIIALIRRRYGLFERVLSTILTLLSLVPLAWVALVVGVNSLWPR